MKNILYILLFASLLFSCGELGPTLCECAKLNSDEALWGNVLAEQDPYNPQSGRLKEDYKKVQKCARKFDGFNNIYRRARTECN